MAEFVRLLVENGEPVVLYGWHREVYSIWLDKLWELKPLMYTGTESVVAKNHAKNEFMAGRTKVLIMSLRSGAGVDGLQGICRTVVFGELDWSPGVHEQCIGRIHRDGQGDKVLAYYLMSDHGSDPEVARALGIKKEQSDGIKQEKPEELVKKAANRWRAYTEVGRSVFTENLYHRGHEGTQRKGGGSMKLAFVRGQWLQLHVNRVGMSGWHVPHVCFEFRYFARHNLGHSVFAQSNHFFVSHIKIIFNTTTWTRCRANFVMGCKINCRFVRTDSKNYHGFHSLHSTSVTRETTDVRGPQTCP